MKIVTNILVDDITKSNTKTTTDNNNNISIQVDNGLIPTTQPSSSTTPGHNKSPVNGMVAKLVALPEHIPAFGLFSALFGVTMFSLASLIVKLLTELHSIEILVFRCVIQFVPYFILTVHKKHPFFGIVGHRLDLGLRCLSGTISMITLYMAYRLMPLTDASTIYLSSPLFVTIFAYILLKEKVTIVQALTGILTIVGVFIISKPVFLFGETNDDSNAVDIYPNRMTGIILSITGAVTSGYSLINLRKLRSTPVPVIVMWYSMVTVVIGSVLLPFIDRWILPYGLTTWLLLLAIGIAGVFNQLFLTLALKYESAGPISVTRSFNIVLSFIWEVTIFYEPVEWTSIAGAGLISSCVVIIALNKCYQENPEKFQKFYGRLLLCCKPQYRSESDSIVDTISESIDKQTNN
ncbi:solute carrier family 35 member G1-like [Oppia nitens]|uniref:solute carrier family 35 member G1-like n=1 Tax=Oppia nitens TaxID=1686743 RepID=UPI0023DABEFB|nr:solute carrier family 35 member G1-like [Oppia nitens]